MDDETPYRVVDLFSGAGGLSLGFDEPTLLNDMGHNLGYKNLEHDSPGFETVLAVEQNTDAARTYLTNFADGKEEQYMNLPDVGPIDYDHINTDELTVVNGDITRVEFENVDLDVDVIIGGPPCPGFSVMNQKTLDELRDHDRYAEMNKLWQYFMRAVEHLEPDMFLIENVPRFLDSAEAVRAYERATEELGYHVTADTLWAHHYEAPQKRQRGFIMGSKHGQPKFPDTISTGDGARERTVWDAIGDLEDKDPSESDDDLHTGRRQSAKTKTRMRVLPEYDPDDSGRAPDRRDLVLEDEETRHTVIERLNEEDTRNEYDKDDPEALLPECWRGSHSGHTDHYGRLASDAPSVTIRKGFIQPMKGRHVHPSKPRSITPREGARLQTFPDTFEFADTSKSSITDQIGNAVPPKLAYELARAMHTHLEVIATEIPQKTNDIKERMDTIRQTRDTTEVTPDGDTLDKSDEGNDMAVETDSPSSPVECSQMD